MFLQNTLESGPLNSHFYRETVSLETRNCDIKIFIKKFTNILDICLISYLKISASQTKNHNNDNDFSGWKLDLPEIPQFETAMKMFRHPLPLT